MVDENDAMKPDQMIVFLATVYRLQFPPGIVCRFRQNG